jgi:hypothetical protein
VPPADLRVFGAGSGGVAEADSQGEIGVTALGELRQRLTDSSIIAQTEPAIANRSAARFQWCQ